MRPTTTLEVTIQSAKNSSIKCSIVSANSRTPVPDFRYVFKTLKFVNFVTKRIIYFKNILYFIRVIA